MKFRIRVARNGYYYVQERVGLNWSRCSPFYWSRAKAEQFVRRAQPLRCTCACH